MRHRSTIRMIRRCAQHQVSELEVGVCIIKRDIESTLDSDIALFVHNDAAGSIPLMALVSDDVYITEAP